MNSPFYVVCSQADDSEVIGYYAIDSQSSGYPYWSPFLFRASPFKTYDEAQKALDYVINEKPISYGSGEIHPGMMTKLALDLCNAKQKGSGTIWISEIQLGAPQYSQKIEGEIKKPKGFVY